MSLPLPGVLAIAGGNSKTDVALVAADGSLLATARGPGMPGADVMEDWVEMLAGLVGEAQQQAGGHGRPAQGRYTAFSAISRSASRPARSYWPTSGWASSASRTRCRPPRSAASTARSS